MICNDANKTGKRYSSYAGKYKELFHKDHSDDCYLNKLIEKLKKGQKVLDIGCGTGRDAKTMYKNGLDVTGIDSSQEMIKISKKICPQCKFYTMDVVKLDFDNASFDAVISFFVLEHLRPKMFATAVSEIRRVLKAGGLFLIVQHDDDFNGYRPDLMTGGKKQLFRFMIPLDRLEMLLIDEGFEVVFAESRCFSTGAEFESADRELAVLVRKRA